MHIWNHREITDVAIIEKVGGNNRTPIKPFTFSPSVLVGYRHRYFMNVKKTVGMYYARAHKSDTCLTACVCEISAPSPYSTHFIYSHRPMDVNDSDDFTSWIFVVSNNETATTAEAKASVENRLPPRHRGSEAAGVPGISSNRGAMVHNPAGKKLNKFASFSYQLK